MNQLTGGFGPRQAYIHGDNGIKCRASESDLKVLNESAVDFILHKAEELDGELESVITGRMTNLTMAVMKDTKLRKVKRVVTMGSILCKGNVNPYAEANIQGDAHASDIISFPCGISSYIGWSGCYYENLYLNREITNLCKYCKEDCKDIAEYIKKCVKAVF